MSPYKEYYQKNKEICKQHQKNYRLRNLEKVKEQHKEYYEFNREKDKTYKRDYYLKNREKILKKTKEHYGTIDKEKLRDWRREYYQTHKKEHRERQKENNKKNPLIRLNANHKRRARMKITDITAGWLNKLYNKSKICPLCDCKMDNNSRKYPDGKTLDHILPLNVGGLHSKNNVRIICSRCNARRPKDGSDILQLAINF